MSKDKENKIPPIFEPSNYARALYERGLLVLHGENGLIIDGKHIKEIRFSEGIYCEACDNVDFDNVELELKDGTILDVESLSNERIGLRKYGEKIK